MAGPWRVVSLVVHWCKKTNEQKQQQQKYPLGITLAKIIGVKWLQISIHGRLSEDQGFSGMILNLK